MPKIVSEGTLVGGWTNPFEKYAQVKLDHFPRDRGKNSKNVWIATTEYYLEWHHVKDDLKNSSN